MYFVFFQCPPLSLSSYGQYFPLTWPPTLVDEVKIFIRRSCTLHVEGFLGSGLDYFLLVLSPLPFISLDFLVAAVNTSLKFRPCFWNLSTTVAAFYLFKHAFLAPEVRLEPLGRFPSLRRFFFFFSPVNDCFLNFPIGTKRSPILGGIVSLVFSYTPFLW